MCSMVSNTHDEDKEINQTYTKSLSIHHTNYYIIGNRKNKWHNQKPRIWKLNWAEKQELMTPEHNVRTRQYKWTWPLQICVIYFYIYSSCSISYYINLLKNIVYNIICVFVLMKLNNKNNCIVISSWNKI